MDDEPNDEPRAPKRAAPSKAKGGAVDGAPASKSGRPAAAARGRPGTKAGAARRGAAGDDDAKLGRDDWLDAAYEAVITGGFDNVRVLSLADKLGISRGSFYWHFADHAELVEALIGRWREREQEAHKGFESVSTDDPVADLLALLDTALARGGSDLRERRFELALREFGRQDPKVAELLLEVDGMRMELFTMRFQRVTGSVSEARDLAVLLYLSVAGAYQALSAPSVATGFGGYMRDVIAEYLIRRQPGARRTTPSRPAEVS